MEYRSIEKLQKKTSLLGFGCMRFPLLENGKIDEVQAEKMLDRAILSGVNYIDTAYPYHEGDSEPFVGRVLNKYNRDSYYLATKLPPWEVKTLEDAKTLFENQLKRLDKDYVDFYLWHALNKADFDRFVGLGIMDYCKELKAQGKIKHLGFSFHDTYEVFEEIIHYYDWDFCQIQLNYMDTEEQAGLKGYELTEQMGIPLVIMEPVKGGSLAGLPKDISDLFDASEKKASLASWALRFVGSLPNVKVILSGMSTMEQVEDNLSTFTPFLPLSKEELLIVREVSQSLRKRVRNGCTDCKYCMPCPAGVNIPKNFSLWNQFSRYQNEAEAVRSWEINIEDSEKAKNCISCGACEEACPQKIQIRENLKTLQEEFDNLHNERK